MPQARGSCRDPLKAGALADFWQERVFAGVPADIEVGAIGVGERRVVHLFPDTTLVVIDWREVAVGGLLVQKQGQGFAPARQASI